MLRLVPGGCHLIDVQLSKYGLPDLSPGKGDGLLGASNHLLLNSRQLFSEEKQEASNLSKTQVHPRIEVRTQKNGFEVLSEYMERVNLSLAWVEKTLITNLS